jgi:hypothetical protein
VVEKNLNDIISISKSTGIGVSPGEMERILKEIYPRSPDSLIRKIIALAWQRETSLIEAPSWSKLSKKLPGVRPGYVEYAPPRVWFLVDTSGSISDYVLENFIGNVADMLRRVVGLEVHVVPWDADVYGDITLRSYSDIEKVKSHLKGGGGTVIKPALEYTLKRMAPGDIVIIASDWYIYDIDNADTIKLLRDLVNKSSMAVFLTAGDNPPKISHKVLVERIPVLI